MIGSVRLIRLAGGGSGSCLRMCQAQNFQKSSEKSFFGFGGSSAAAEEDEAGSAEERVQFHSEKRTLGYSADQMFEVVSRVEDYHQFVPWCKKSQVVFRNEEHLQAALVIGFPPLFGEAYNSHVVMFKPHLCTAVCTDMKLFHHLKTVWKFETIPDHPHACHLDFAVSFAFKSSMHTYLAKRFFDDVIKQNVKAFLDQAGTKYGPPKSTSGVPKPKK